MEYITRECNQKGTKIYKTILGIIGGIVSLATICVGINAIGSLSILSGIIFSGILPLEVIITYLVVKEAKVENVTEEIYEEFTFHNEHQILDEDNDALLKTYDNVMYRKNDEYFVYDTNRVTCEGKTGVIGRVQFTSIKPIKQYVDNERELTPKKRIIEFIPKNKK